MKQTFAFLIALLLQVNLAEARAGLCSGPLPAGDGGKLTVQDTRFAIGGVPKFIAVFAYFGATRQTAADVGPVFDYLCSAGFNGVRIFADYWETPAYASGGHRNENLAVIRANGALNTARVDNLKAILSRARSAGLVVDLSFGAEIVAGRTVASHIVGIGSLALALNHPDFNHVMFDVQNEHTNAGIPTPIEVGQLITAGKSGSPGRPVFASVAIGEPYNPAPTPSDPRWPCHVGWAPSAAGMINEVSRGGMVVAVHECRLYQRVYDPSPTAWWETGIFSWLTYQGVRQPIYAQEPDRWMQAYPDRPCSSAPASPFVDNECELTSSILAYNARDAFADGAAAWTFHTESFFFPTGVPGQGFRTLGVPELEVLGWPGFESGMSLMEALGPMGPLIPYKPCWGGRAAPGWIPMPCIPPW